MNTKLDTKRILIFLAFAFGIAWAAGLVIYLNGGLSNSPQILPGGITLALALMATVYMGAPALANVFTRLITREGWKNTMLRPNIRRGWPYWLIAWVAPAILTILGAAVYFLLFPQHFDANLTSLKAQLEQVGQGAMNPWMIVLIQTMLGVLISPLVNSIATFGEEFGWRAYLLPKLMPLGSKKAMLASGIIWGVWHWPVIFMGYEYGLDYPGFPWVGPLLFLVFATAGGIFLSWVTLRGGSVWPAVIGHSAMNGIAALPVLFVRGTPNPLLGPLVVGVIGGIAYIALAVVLFFHPRALAPVETLPQVIPAEPVAAVS